MDDGAGAAILDIDLSDEKSFLQFSPVLRSHITGTGEHDITVTAPCRE